MRSALCAALIFGVAACSSTPAPTIIKEVEFIPCVKEEPQVSCPVRPNMSGLSLGKALAEGELVYEKCLSGFLTLQTVIRSCMGVED